MLFFINSRINPGVTNDQVIAHLERDIDKDEWELIKKGVIQHWFFKVDDPPGVIALVNCDSIDEVRELVNSAPAVKEGLLTFDIDPVNRFPQFD